MAVITLVDDDQNILASVSVALEAEGFEVSTFFDSEMAMIELSRNPPDLAVLDIKMPKLTGTEMLKKIRTKSELPVIFLTSKDDEIDEAVGFELGADDYITKPFQLDQLELLTAKALERTALIRENRALRARLEGAPKLPGLIGESASMRAAFQLVERYAASAAPVLIEGESGTGKELFARALHERSGRRGPFVALNCAAICRM